MALYQRKSLATGEDVGAPAPLPRIFQGGMSDADLARVGELVAAEFVEEWGDAGFVRAPDPPAPESRWVHQVLFKKRLAPAERIAIRAASASDAAIFDFLDVLNSSEQVNLDDEELVAALAYLVVLGLLAPDRPAEIRA